MHFFAEMRMIKRSKFPAWGLSIFRRVLKYPVAFQPRWPVLGHVYTSAYKQVRSIALYQQPLLMSPIVSHHDQCPRAF